MLGHLTLLEGSPWYPLNRRLHESQSRTGHGVKDYINYHLSAAVEKASTYLPSAFFAHLYFSLSVMLTYCGGQFIVCC
jgi:hypothetical protein